MATLAAIAQALQQRFQTEVATPNSLAVQWDNQPLQPGAAAWARFSVQPVTSDQVTTGSQRRWRTEGAAFATIFYPLEKGSAAALALADAVVAAFRGVTVSGATLRAPRVAYHARTENDRWWQITVVCPFYSDEIDNAP